MKWLITEMPYQGRGTTRQLVVDAEIGGHQMLIGQLVEIEASQTAHVGIDARARRVAKLDRFGFVQVEHVDIGVLGKLCAIGGAQRGQEWWR